MMARTLQQQIEDIVQNLPSVPTTRKYWMVRTQGGSLYSTFRLNKFIALEHDAVDYHTILALRRTLKNDDKGFRDKVRDLIADKVKDDGIRSGLIAGQMIRFALELNEGDIVIIPSENSKAVSFGQISSSKLFEASADELRRTECNYVFRKKVDWIQEVGRDTLDPYLFRMLQAHQAINDVSGYAEIIQRSISNFFITDDQANLVLEVGSTEQISAPDLFSMGHFLLMYLQKYSKENDLDVDLNQIDVKINLNSPGRIQFKSPSKGTLWLLSILVLAINGGGLKINALGLDLSTDGVIKNIIRYQNNAQDRSIRDTLIKNMDSLRVKSPDDALKVFQQFSDNKNLPK